MSRLITNAIRSTSASADAITFDNSGKPAFPNGGAGKILQVLQTFKNDTASTNTGTFADISGLTVTITPSATSSKILYTGGLYLAGSGSEANFRLKRTIGGTATDISVSSVLDDDADGSFACLLYTSPSPRDKRQARMPSSA